MIPPKHTPTPWKWQFEDWRGQPQKFKRFIIGGISEPDEDDESCATAVAIVEGNATSGGIATANAELIVRAVNAHEDLLAACKAAFLLLPFDSKERVQMVAAIAKATNTTPTTTTEQRS